MKKKRLSDIVSGAWNIVSSPKGKWGMALGTAIALGLCPSFNPASGTVPVAQSNASQITGTPPNFSAVQPENQMRQPSILKNFYWDTVIIDPGHGGTDPGATYGNLFEKHYTLAISLALEKALIARGVNVRMTRRVDRTLDSGSRVAFANKIAKEPWHGNVLFISLHVNSTEGTGYTADKLHGPFFVYDTRYSPEELQRLKEIGDPILQKIRRVGLPPCTEFTYLADKYSKDGRVELVRKINLQDILLPELGNIRNYTDRKYLGYSTSLANAIAEALVEYKGSN